MLRRMRQRLLAGALVSSCLAFFPLSLVGCSSSDETGQKGAASTDGSGPRARVRTVFLILMENKEWSEIKDSTDAPYINGTLLPAASVAENYKGAKSGDLHPSEPNYIWLEAGDSLGIEANLATADNDPVDNHRDVTDHLVTLLEAAGVTWRSYQEDIVGDVCPLERVGNYAPKHNPMVFFDDVTNTNDPQSPRCIEHVRPLTELESDLAGEKTGRYNFITDRKSTRLNSSHP